jgi:hypothetical protein
VLLDEYSVAHVEEIAQKKYGAQWLTHYSFVQKKDNDQKCGES